jgi:hypothetical protein
VSLAKKWPTRDVEGEIRLVKEKRDGGESMSYEREYGRPPSAPTDISRSAPSGTTGQVSVTKDLVAADRERSRQVAGPSLRLWMGSGKRRTRGAGSRRPISAYNLLAHKLSQVFAVNTNDAQTLAEPAYQRVDAEQR